MSILKGYIAWLVVLSLALPSSFLIEPALGSNTSTTGSSVSYYYAGYYLYAREVGYGEWGLGGVMGNIYTISVGILSWPPGYRHFCEWVTIILKYNPVLYWIQLGYLKKMYPEYTWDFYLEIRDEYGYRIEFCGPADPVPGVTYRYKIMYYGGSKYVAEIWRGFNRIWQIVREVSPYVGRDLQAMVETCYDADLEPDICIDGSHFSELQCIWFYEWEWYYWYTHVTAEDPPYKVEEVSDYEFYASGP